jgi:hypothetical protein
MAEFTPGGGDGIPKNPNVSNEGSVPEVDVEVMSEDDFNEHIKRAKNEERPDTIFMEGDEVKGFSINESDEKINGQEDPNIGEKDDKQTGTGYNNDEMGKENFNGSNNGNGGHGPENGNGPENDPKNKVEKIKDIFVKSKFLKPDETQQQEMSENLKELSSILGHEFKGVVRIDETIKEFSEYGEKSSVTKAQFEIAVEDKKILGEAADLAARKLENTDSSLRNDFFMGSKHMDNMLAQDLKGLGGEISKHYVANPKIDKQLNILEITRQNVDFSNPASVETLVQKTSTKIETIGKEDFEDERDVLEQDEVLTVLNEERGKYKISGENNSADSDAVKKIAEAVAAEVTSKGRVNRYMNNDEEKSLFNSKYDLDKDARSWDISPLYMAIDFKYMNGRMGWRMDTPAEWYKKESAEDRDRIDVMITMNQAAAGLESAGKDLDYVMKNDAAFKFTNEHMTQLFNTDFKLVMSKLTNDLCEFYTDVNGHQALRYKEKYYKLFDPKDAKDEYGQDKYGFALDKNGERKVLHDDKSNRGKGARTIDKDVLKNLEHFQDYKDQLARFLAEQNGNEVYEKDEGDHKKGEVKLSFMDMMNAYTAWNMVYAMGDTSVWDRMRVLPTYNQIISDAIRTLNPEYKAKGKMMIEKSGRIKKSDALFEAEYFSGQMAEWAIKTMELERDLGEKILGERGEVKEYIEKPIDGVKTFRDKVLDRDIELLSNKTFYGLLDFVHGGRDLYEGSDPNTGVNFYNKKIGKNEKVTLAQLVMNYAYKTDDDGNKTFIPKAERREFSFGDKTTTFQNEFHDMLEGASIMYESVMGKVKDAKIENSGKWAEKIKTAQRMINGIKINDENALLYGRDPNLWRDAIIGTWGCDMSRLSSDHPYLLRPVEKNGFSQAYSRYSYHFLVDTDKLNLTNTEVNINELMRLLGVYLDPNENPNSEFVVSRNNRMENKEIRQTQKLIRQQRGRSEFDVVTGDIKRMIDEVENIKESNDEIDRMKSDFKRISKLGRGFSDHASSLLEAIKKEAEREKKRKL